jgi:hypothetical protein
VRTIKILVVTMAAFACFVLVAQDPEYQGWMKSVAGSNGKLQKGIAAKDAGAAAEATNLETVFKQVESFWQKRGAADAVGFAKQAHEAAGAAAKAISAGDWDKAAAEGKSIGATCQGCHAAHRGGEKGNFQIK